MFYLFITGRCGVWSSESLVLLPTSHVSLVWYIYQYAHKAHNHMKIIHWLNWTHIAIHVHASLTLHRGPSGPDQSPGDPHGDDLPRDLAAADGDLVVAVGDVLVVAGDDLLVVDIVVVAVVETVVCLADLVGIVLDLVGTVDLDLLHEREFYFINLFKFYMYNVYKLEIFWILS